MLTIVKLSERRFILVDVEREESGWFCVPGYETQAGVKTAKGEVVAGPARHADIVDEAIKYATNRKQLLTHSAWETEVAQRLFSRMRIDEMRLRNRSPYQVANIITFILGSMNRVYLVQTGHDGEWTYLTIRPAPKGDDYERLAKFAERAGTVLTRAP